MAKKKKTVQKTATLTEAIAVEESEVDSLRQDLEKVKELEGVIGYILRDSSIATINLEDPEKLVDYAILSSLALEVGDTLADRLELGDVRDVTLKGKDVKVISLTRDETKISVFVDKEDQCEKVLSKLRALKPG